MTYHVADQGVWRRENAQARAEQEAADSSKFRTPLSLHCPAEGASLLRTSRPLSVLQLDILRFRFGTPLTEVKDYPNSFKRTEKEYRNVTKKQLRDWKKKCVWLSGIDSFNLCCRWALLAAAPPTTKALGTPGRSVVLGDLEEELYNWITKCDSRACHSCIQSVALFVWDRRRDQGHVVTRQLIRVEALKQAKTKPGLYFLASSKWISSFLRRWQLSNRRITTKRTQSAAAREDLAAKEQHFLKTVLLKRKVFMLVATCINRHSLCRP